MSVFTITELRRTGVGVLEATPTVLRWTSDERSAPRGVIEHAQTVKTVREDVPGGEEPVEQVISVGWEPFELNGVWDDRHAGPGFAERMYREVAELVGRTPMVRLQIDRLVFVGLLTSNRPGYRTRDRSTWSLTLSPHRNETVGSIRPAIATTAVRPVAHHVAAATASLGSIEAGHAAAAGIPLATDLHGTALDDLDALAGITQRLQSASEAGFEQDAAQRLLSLGALFRGVRGAAQAIPQRFARARSTTQVAYNDVVHTLRFEEWTRTASADARVAILGADAAALDMQARARQRPRAIHRARAGESLHRISQLYYGTPAGWRTIYTANNLSSLTLTGTEELIIPERP